MIVIESPGRLGIIFALQKNSYLFMVLRARSVTEGNFSLKYVSKMEEENKRKGK